MNKSNTASKGKLKDDDKAPRSIQEIAKDVVGKDELKAPFTPVTEKDTAHPPLQDPAKEDVDGNTAQAQAATEKFNGKWQEQIGTAKNTWSRLTEEELEKSEGKQHQLAGLVQGRYGLTRDEADKQVKDFIEKFAA